MNNIMKYLLFSIVLLLNANLVFGQKIDYKKPPSQENTYLFKVIKYHRQPAPPAYMRERIKQIADKPTTAITAVETTLNFSIPLGYSLLVSMAHAAAATTSWSFTVIGGDYVLVP